MRDGKTGMGGGKSYRLIGSTLFRRVRLPWTVSTAVLAILLLAACSSNSTQPTVEPSPTPTDTPEPGLAASALLVDFDTAVIPPPDPEQLAQLRKILSLVPAGYGSAVRLDLKALREDQNLGGIINPDSLALEMALPSLVASVFDGIVVATDLQTGDIITGFNGTFEIEDLLQLASGFGLQLGDSGPENHRGHQIWKVTFLDDNVAIGSASANTGVAGVGSTPDVDPIDLVKQSLDAYDRETSNILSSPVTSRLLANVPSGFVSAVMSNCSDLSIFSASHPIPGCLGAAVSASLLDDQTAVLDVLVAFISEELAEAALERNREVLEAQAESQGLRGIGVRQEGDLVRARILADLSQFQETFRMFTPR